MSGMNGLEEKLGAALGEGDLLIVIPPFENDESPLLGPHVLQAYLGENGYKVDVLYLNALLASFMDPDLYYRITFGQYYWMLGERLFARSAHGMPPLGLEPESCYEEGVCISGKKENHHWDSYNQTPFDLDAFMGVEELCTDFIQAAAGVIAGQNYPIVGCSVKWEQANVSVALLNRIKAAVPETLTIIGGAKCKEGLAQGVASLSDSLDYVFSGEADASLLKFLRERDAGTLPAGKVIPSIPLASLDELPMPDFDEYFNQVNLFFGPQNRSSKFILYESSRGCWKSLKKKCTFCNMNNVGFRQKSHDKVLSDILSLGKKYPGLTISMTDDNIPVPFYKKLLPKLAELPERLDFEFFTNTATTLEELKVMKQAGVNHIVPGIESLSTPVLDLMNKKSTARQNLIFMRNVRALKIRPTWVFLFGFPGEEVADYREMLEFLPFIHHLYPPFLTTHVKFFCYSEYHRDPGKFGIKNLAPWEAYGMVFPETADRERLALLYHGEHDCAAGRSPATIEMLTKDIKAWQENWEDAILYMKPFMDQYMIYDKRDFLDESKTHFLDYQDAKTVMTCQAYTPDLKDSPLIQWALEEKLGVILDDWYLPLILASPALLFEFEGKTR